MEPAATKTCPICSQGLTLPTVFHPAGKDHPMHIKCMQQMMNTMKECPVCTQSTDCILEGLQIKNAIRLTFLDGLERLNALNKQLEDEKELIEGFDNFLTLANSNQEFGDSVEFVASQRDEAVHRRDNLVSKMQSLAGLLRTAQFISKLTESFPTILIIDGRPFLQMELNDNAKKANQPEVNSPLQPAAARSLRSAPVEQ